MSIDQPTVSVRGVVGIAAEARSHGNVGTIIEQLSTQAGLSFVVLGGAENGLPNLIQERFGIDGLRTREAVTGAVLEPDTVYVAPVGVDVVVRESRLEVEHGSIGEHRSFDQFLGSLAVDQVERSIGVVLAPEHGRGAQGLAAIGRAGGCPIGPLPWDQRPGDPIDTPAVMDQELRLIRDRVVEHLSDKHPRTLDDSVAARRLLCDEGLLSPRLRAVVRHLALARRSGVVRAWVPGCGTGQDV
jgi:hypothetical protein